MRRLTALALVASLALQAAGCATSYPAPPAVSVEAPARARGVQTAEADLRTTRTTGVAARIDEPTIPATEFWGGQAGGMIVGVGLVAVIALAILVGGRSSSASSTGTGTPGTGGGNVAPSLTGS